MPYGPSAAPSARLVLACLREMSVCGVRVGEATCECFAAINEAYRQMKIEATISLTNCLAVYVIGGAGQSVCVCVANM